ncbi:MAG: succinylglutamate desuccinylase/aspartoacylase family protein [Proteobacteria bacterium]|nr:succinylglutamate desuccinylase/aspartoacylase family protein [Pseudomonadota bacterium]MBI3495868.1 succinylglutamate desuccinylase/aspartoacylase family protein [Pseudomonadota bacterium]
MTTRPTRLSTDIDFDRDGKQVSNIFMAWSRNASAYGEVQIPIACIRNGPGKTMLYTAGTHGDEYEGQVALLDLIRALEPGEIRGRVIIVPAANFPAAMNGSRLSPYDNGNLNRAHPGDPDGGPTAQIAYYIGQTLVPMADAYHDLHAGGSSLDYLPFVSSHLSGNAELDQRQLAAAKAFAPPMVVIGKSSDDRLAQRAAHKRGIIAFGGEFGGRGAVTISGVKLVATGIRNMLHFLGILPDWQPPKPKAPTRLMQIAGRRYFVYAPANGLFEPAVELGDEVIAGQKAGRLHFIEDPMRPPIEPTFAIAGTVVCKRVQGRCERGDCLAHLATPYAG